ncbi:MAG: HD domain-containing protein [Clostridia bacterium]|nr:HD domain-containing protein [Clostridia bacterium]
MVEILDKILLSKNAANEFYKCYNGEFKKWLLGVLPEIEDCKKLAQDNPWHIYNCLDHILHSVDEMARLSLECPISVRRMLVYVMLLHDMGKPQCKSRRFSKLYGREVDSFFSHNKASVSIARRVLPVFGFDSKSTKIMLTLIENHDVFMTVSLKEYAKPHHKILDSAYLDGLIDALAKESGIDGVKAMQYLLWVGEADNLAQNPDMTAKPLQMLEKMNEMLEGK